MAYKHAGGLPPVIVFDLWGTLVHSQPAESADGVAIPALHERGSQRAVLFNDVEETLIGLRKNGHRIGLCSNLAPEFVEMAFRLVPGLDSYSISCQVGAKKPDPRIYQHVVTQLQCHPRDILFIGDSVKKDYDGPRAFGMRAALIDRKAGQTLAQVMAAAVRKGR